ncbi:MAG: phage tail tape measure protein [Pseudomonas sp.]|nr:phage tail tape measure protein [Pseudomonas sp.]
MKHHGRATITYNGMRLRSKPGATLNLGGTSRAPEPLDDGTVGYAESTAAPELSCTVPLTADLAVDHNLNLAMRISADVTRLMGGLAKGEGGLRKFGNAAKQEMAALGQFAGSMEGKLAQLGLGISAVAVGVQSARMDKDLKQLQLTAGATADEAKRLRTELINAQIATGQGADELKGGVDALVAGGLSLGEATATVKPMADTLAVAKTNADALARAMGVAGKMFDIDLSKTEDARLLLDKMVVAGRAGNAELENLPDVFARVGNSAKISNLSLDKTLALVETLSLVEPNAERLSTLTDSTLRVFTNRKYMEDASKATGIKFFNADESRRDALKVLADIKGKYDTLGTDKKRFGFISKAFGNADLDTQKGLKTLLDGNSLNKLDSILADVSSAGGTIARDLPDAIGNAVDQTGRLKGALREAGDGFAQPINDAISGAIKFGLDSKVNGGLELSGTDMILGGAAGALGIAAAARYGGKAVKGLAGKFGGVGVGVATGKALEEAAGVTPVFVVNMSDGGMGGSLSPVDALAGELGGPKVFSKLKTTMALLGGVDLAAIPSMGAGAVALSAGAVAGAGAAGYGVGTLINDYLLTNDGPLGSEFGASLGESIGEGVAYLLSPFSEDARAAIAVNKAADEAAAQDAERLAAALDTAGARILTNSKDFAREMQAQALLIGERIGLENVPAFYAAQPKATGPLALNPVLPRSLEDGLQHWTQEKVQAGSQNAPLNDLLLGKTGTLERQLAAVTGKLREPTGPLAQGAVIPAETLAAATRTLKQEVVQAMRSTQQAPAEVNGLIEVRVSNDGRPPLVTRLQSSGGVDMKTAYVGRTGAGS